MSGPAIFRVPRWEWVDRITQAGMVRAVPELEAATRIGAEI